MLGSSEKSKLVHLGIFGDWGVGERYGTIAITNCSVVKEIWSHPAQCAPGNNTFPIYCGVLHID